MIPANEPRRRPSVLDLLGDMLTMISGICASLKDAFVSPETQSPQSRDAAVERVCSFADMQTAAPSPGKLWRQIPKHDLVALHAPFPLVDLAFAFSLASRRPLVVHWHNDIVTRANLRWLVEPLVRLTLRRAKAIVVPDHSVIDGSPLLREFDRKCHVVPFGVDVAAYDWAGIEPHHVNDRGRLVLACGRLAPHKGLDLLIRAAAAHDFETWIIGEGAERTRLEQLIIDLGVDDRVRLLGSVKDCERRKLMCVADIFVMPSVSNAETFGIVQLEAMAAGRPIVNTALDTAVPRVARHGIEAITVPPGDAAKLGEAINTLIRDPARRRSMGQAARKRATTRYSAAAFRQRLEMIYRDAAATDVAPATSLLQILTIGSSPGGYD